MRLLFGMGFGSGLMLGDMSDFDAREVQSGMGRGKCQLGGERR